MGVPLPVRFESFINDYVLPVGAAVDQDGVAIYRVNVVDGRLDSRIHDTCSQILHGVEHICEPIARECHAGASRVVTVTSTVPAVPAGETAVILVSESILKLAAALLPNRTEVAPLRLVPVMATVVPPNVGPLDGLTPVTIGAGI